MAVPAEQECAADALQRPLRSRFQARLTPGVDMTSNVKSCEQIFSELHDVFCPRCIGRAGASKKRRLILLLAVGWLPPYLHPPSACLCLGSSILLKPPNAVEGTTKPGLRLFRYTLGNLLSSGLNRDRSRPYGVTETSWAMAHRNPASSRAMATVTTLACLPRATSRR